MTNNRNYPCPECGANMKEKHKMSCDSTYTLNTRLFPTEVSAKLVKEGREEVNEVIVHAVYLNTKLMAAEYYIHTLEQMIIKLKAENKFLTENLG